MREAPAGVELPGQQFLLRAGLVRTPSAAVWSHLPLGQRAWERLLAAATRIAEAHHAQKVALPPARLVESRSGRSPQWQHGESPIWAAWNLAERDIRSYRHLPLLLYAVSQRFHGPGQFKAGILGSATTRQLQLFGFFPDQESAQDALRRLRSEFVDFLGSLNLRPLIARAGENDSRDWLFACGEGTVSYFHCPECGYVGLPAATVGDAGPDDTSPVLELQEVETPDCTTIAGLAEFLDVPAANTMKVVFYTTDENRVICAAIRGDLNIDEAKLSAVLGGIPFYPSSNVEVRGVGSVPGYGSPIGLRGATIIADPTVMAARNLVAGANREPYHTLNVNAGRDFRPDRVVDLRAVQAGDTCPDCDGTLADGLAFELGRDRIYLTDPTGAAEAQYLDVTGKSQPVVLTEMVIDLDHVFAAVAEANHDADGLRWPAKIAPAEVHLLAIKIKKDDAVAAAAERIYDDLQARGLAVVLDDRDERPGVAFTEADLLGAPLRLTISPRSLEEGGIEVKWRGEAERSIIPEDGLPALLERLTGM